MCLCVFVLLSQPLAVFSDWSHIQGVKRGRKDVLALAVILLPTLDKQCWNAAFQ